MRMVRRFFVLATFMMLGRSPMMLGGIFVVFSCITMMLCAFF
jgi:hypothetical protein